MVGPRFIYGYLSEGATGLADSTASGYDPQNAVALDRVTTWKSGGTSSQRLIIHAGSNITPTGLGISGGNYSEWGTTTLQHSTDNVTWTTFHTLASLPSTDTTVDYFVDFVAAGLTPVAKAWWALRWTAATAAPEVACFYLGTLSTLSENYQFPDEASEVFGVNSEQSEGKVVVAEEVARRRARFNLAFPITASSTVRDEVRTILRSEGGPLRPFYFAPVDESGTSSAGQAYLVRYENAAFGWRRLHVNPYEFSVPLLEEV